MPGVLPASQALPRTPLKGSPLGSPWPPRQAEVQAQGAHSTRPVCGEDGPRGSVGFKELHVQLEPG